MASGIAGTVVSSLCEVISSVGTVVDSGSVWIMLSERDVAGEECSAASLQPAKVKHRIKAKNSGK